jgi:hypothetical protein
MTSEGYIPIWIAEVPSMKFLLSLLGSIFNQFDIKSNLGFSIDTIIHIQIRLTSVLAVHVNIFIWGYAPHHLPHLKYHCSPVHTGNMILEFCLDYTRIEELRLILND